MNLKLSQCHPINVTIIHPVVKAENIKVIWILAFPPLSIQSSVVNCRSKSAFFSYLDSFPPRLPAQHLLPPTPLYAATKNNLLKYKTNDIIILLKTLEWLPITL